MDFGRCRDLWRLFSFLSLLVEQRAGVGARKAEHGGSGGVRKEQLLTSRKGFAPCTLPASSLQTRALGQHPVSVAALASRTAACERKDWDRSRSTVSGRSREGPGDAGRSRARIF